MTTHNDDPRYSAYVLGELEGLDRAEFEDYLATSAEARDALGEHVEFADALEAAMASELAAEEFGDQASFVALGSGKVDDKPLARAALEPATPNQKRRFHGRSILLGAAASLALFFGAAGLLGALGGDDDAADSDESTTAQNTATAPPASAGGSTVPMGVGGAIGRAGPLTTTMKFDYALVAPDDNAADALVEVVAEAADIRNPIAVAVVVDASTSMDGNKIANAKRAAKELVSRLRGGDFVSVISFSDDVVTAVEGHRIGGKRDATANKIDAIELRGSTCISCGLEAAYKALSKAPKSHARRVVLISDGDANKGIVGAEPLGGLAYQGLSQKASTTAIGIGRGYNVEVMRSVAAGGTGSYYFAYNSKEIPGILERELASLVKVVATDAVLTFTATESSQLGKVSTAGARQDRHTAVVELGQLAAGERRKVLVPLELISPELGEVLRVDLSFTDSDGKSRKNALIGKLARSSDPAAIERTMAKDPLIERARVDAAKTLSLAMRRYEAGDIGGAQQLLRKSAADVGRTQGITGGSARLAGELDEINSALDNVGKYGVGSNGWSMTLRVNDARAWENGNLFDNGYFNQHNGNMGVIRNPELE